MSDSRPRIGDALERFIRAQFQVSADDPGFSQQVHLWEEGYVDSTGLIEIIAFLEQTFDVKIPDEALFSQEFTNIDGLAALVAGLRDADRTG